jgi:hypothetical protein
MRETAAPDYPVRTEQNVVDSDGTLILYRDRLLGGTELTRRLCVKHKRPALSVDLAGSPDPNHVRAWLIEQDIRTLNVAGPRESSSPGVQEQACKFLQLVLSGRRPGGNPQAHTQ